MTTMASTLRLTRLEATQRLLDYSASAAAPPPACPMISATLSASTAERSHRTCATSKESTTVAVGSSVLAEERPSCAGQSAARERHSRTLGMHSLPRRSWVPSSTSLTPRSRRSCACVAARLGFATLLLVSGLGTSSAGLLRPAPLHLPLSWGGMSHLALSKRTGQLYVLLATLVLLDAFRSAWACYSACATPQLASRVLPFCRMTSARGCAMERFPFSTHILGFRYRYKPPSPSRDQCCRRLAHPRRCGLRA